MLVPEAAMDEHDGTVSGQHHVGAARQVAAVKPEAEAGGVQCTPYAQLGRGVAFADGAHTAAAFVSAHAAPDRAR
jgi:hypothetical protein